jgi:hypothetical protein
MEIGGIDIILYCGQDVNVQSLVVGVVEKFWPNLIVEEDSISPDMEEIFIYENEEWQAASNDETKDMEEYGCHYIYLLWDQEDYLQRVTVCVLDLEDDVTFDIVAAIQLEFLKTKRKNYGT